MEKGFQEICEAYRARLAGRSAGWCQAHPGDDERQWSAQQLVEHLVLALSSAGRLLEARLQKRRPTRARATLLQRILRFNMLRRGRIPRGAPAPPFVRPGLLHWPAMDGCELAEALREEMESQDALLNRCAAQFGEGAAASHFLLGPLSAKEWRRFHTLHFRHHLEQMDRIAAAVGPLDGEPALAAAE